MNNSLLYVAFAGGAMSAITAAIGCVGIIYKHDIHLFYILYIVINLTA